MQDKLVVTIVDESGSRQFRLPKNATKILVFICFVFAVIVLCCFFLMKFLMEKIDDIAFKKNIAISEYKYIYQKNNFLKDQIKQKGEELAIVGQKIDDLENIVNVKKTTDESSKYEKIDLQDLSSSQKTLILSLIPNGEPVASYTSKNLAYQKSHSAKKSNTSTGYDFVTSQGTPVYATADGVIDLTKSNSSNGYGNFIKISHSFGFSSMYAHLQKSLVKKGDFVQKGQLIGYSGHTGNSNGDTLYYEVRFLGKVLDPTIYTAWNSNNFEEVFDHDSSIDWKSLVWTIQDMAQLQTYKLSYQSNDFSVGEKK
ncbi:M23 family metallopeptidase [Helicobacter cappadocius]|uniref:M23 family metallopeptidase n=1 Tax=Helicobacter cappadocius TaxID=3063998 RepID=A0AA90SSU2_9HELI|nr:MULTISPECIES: M23 family metallopeptidase [unclassified Helicobacter]MDO7253422.1 M23 family metallopeptidase [Helicobacter sp. faydin-H75]MDP2539314.1 M23 family metallopeptidase [Helicobacter sp. faydin-H76]